MTEDHPFSTETGFSLTEVLITVFILSLATSVIVLTAPARPDPLDSATDTVEREINRIMDIAMVSGNVMGLDVEGRAITTLRYREGRWLPQGRPVTIDRVDIETVRPIAQQSVETEKVVSPDIVFDPTGVVSAAELTFEHRNQGARIRVAIDGAITNERQ